MQITWRQSFITKSMLCSMTTKLPPWRLVELDQKLAQLVDEARVDACARLVEQHEPRRRHERHRDVDQLLLPVRQRAGERVRDVLQPEELDHLVGVARRAQHRAVRTGGRAASP